MSRTTPLNPDGAGRKPTLPTVECPRCGQIVGASYLQKHLRKCQGESGR